MHLLNYRIWTYVLINMKIVNNTRLNVIFKKNRVWHSTLHLVQVKRQYKIAKSHCFSLAGGFYEKKGVFNSACYFHIKTGTIVTFWTYVVCACWVGGKLRRRWRSPLSDETVGDLLYTLFLLCRMLVKVWDDFQNLTAARAAILFGNHTPRQRRGFLYGNTIQLKYY